MISQSAEYSLRAVLCLASGTAGGAMTTQQIARQTRVPPSYLSKVLQTLGRAGIVSSQRGLNGGYSLKLPPEQITLLAIVSAAELSHRILVCPLNLPENANCLCSLHRRLDAVAKTTERMLSNATVADLLAESVADHLDL